MVATCLVGGTAQSGNSWGGCGCTYAIRGFIIPSPSYPQWPFLVPSDLLPPLTPCADITSCVAQVPGASLAWDATSVPTVFCHLQFILPSILLLTPSASFTLCLSSNGPKHPIPVGSNREDKKKKIPGFEFQFHKLGALRSLVSYGTSLSLGSLSWETEAEPVSKVYKDQTRRWVWLVCKQSGTCLGLERIVMGAGEL